MVHLLETLKAAYRAKKLHRKLIIRIAILASILLIATFALFFDTVVRNLSTLPVVALAIIGYFFGYYIVSKMRSVVWHEHEEVLTVGTLDVLGVVILIAYYAARELADVYLAHAYSNAFFISGFALAFFWGIVLGRLVAIVRRIDELFRTEL